MKYRCIVVDPPWPYGQRWETRRDGRGRPRFGPGASGRYSLMALEELCAIPVAGVAADSCLCFLWITAPHLAMGSHTKVLEAWGFAPATLAFVWIKMNAGRWRLVSDAARDYIAQPVLPGFDSGEPLKWILGEQTMDALTVPGPGYYTFSNAEFVVVGRKGRLPQRHKDPELGKERITKQVVYAPRRDHSEKPDEVYDRIAWQYPHVAPKLELFGRRLRGGWTVVGNEAPGCEGEDIRASLERLADEE